MQIVTAAPGDSVWKIASRYGVRVGDVIRLNGLDDPNRLVPGQALLLPVYERIHAVRPGDTLWRLSRIYSVPMAAIAWVNGLVSPFSLYPGMRLRIPSPMLWGPKTTIQVNGYLETTKEAERDRQIVEETARYLTYISLFQYIVNPDGSLKPAPAVPALEAIAMTRALPLMVLTNTENGVFSLDVAHAVLADAVAREKLLVNIENTVQKMNYAGVNVDFEHIPPADRDRYTDFLKELTVRMHAIGRLVSTALAPKTSGEQPGTWYEAHDYGAHGAVVDFVILMTYEWGWAGGPPMAVAPVSQVRRVLDYAVTVIPRSKIMMSAPLYGYNWTLPYKAGGRFAASISPQEAVNLAWDAGAPIQYDESAQSPFFHYYDESGKEHVVWFEDARSMQAKFQLVKEYGLRGISFWALGDDFPQVWPLLAGNFHIRHLQNEKGSFTLQERTFYQP